MSENVLVSQLEGGWQVDIAGRERYVYLRLTDAIRRAGQVISSDASPGASAAVTWSFADNFMREALAVANERRALAAREAELTRRTNEAIVSLALEGLTNGDIAAVLGLTPARVSQIVQDTAEWLWGADDPSGEPQFVKLAFGKGWRAARGRGPLPKTLTFAGITFVPTGGATSVNGQPWRHTYVPIESGA